MLHVMLAALPHQTAIIQGEYAHDTCPNIDGSGAPRVSPIERHKTCHDGMNLS
jgi:hypothetical protein